MHSVKVIIGSLLVLVILISTWFIPRESDESLIAAPNWTQSPVTIAGEKYIIDSFVIKDGAEYKMWYTHLTLTLPLDQLYSQIKILPLDDLLTALLSYELEDFFDNLVDLNPFLPTIMGILDNVYVEIGYATSTDGKDWTVVDSSVLTGQGPNFLTGVGFPAVVKVDAADYRMWYTRIDSSLNQLLLQTIFTDIGNSDPVVRKAAIESLLNSTRTVIGYATSSNGITWSVQKQTAFAASGSPYNIFNSVGSPSVIKDGNTYKMWYTRPKTAFDGTALDEILSKAGSGTLNMDDLVNVIDDTSLVIGYAESLDGSTWTDISSEVFSGGASLWQSVCNPFVIKSGGTYSMWFTAANSNLNTANAWRSVVQGIFGLNPSLLWSTMQTSGFAAFVTALIGTDLTGLQAVFIDSYGSIGLTTSTDGLSWSPPATDLTRSTANQFGGVGNPSVIKSVSQTEIWFSQGFPALTWQNIVDWLQGVGPSSGLGYAQVSTIVFGGGGGGGGGTPATIYASKKICYPLNSVQYTLANVVLTSEDENFEIAIPRLTMPRDEEGEPLICISCDVVVPPPPAPKDKVVLAAYIAEPERAIFQPSVTMTIFYDLASIPKGVDEKTLVIAHYKTDTREWENLREITVDAEKHSISGKTYDFGIFGLISDKEKATTPTVPPTQPPSTPEPPKPAAFVTSAFTVTPTTIKVGGTASVDITVTNTGGQVGTYTVKLLINDAVVQTQDVTLRPGGLKTISFSVSGLTSGNYRIGIDKLSSSLVVQEIKVQPPVTPVVPETPEPKPFNWVPVALGVMIGVVIAVVGGWFIINQNDESKIRKSTRQGPRKPPLR